MSRRAKKEGTRRRLIDAAAEVIAERGFHAASLMEVASRAGLTTGAVYSNFRSKEDLFLAVIREMAMPLDLGSETDPLWQRLTRAAVLAVQSVDLPASRRLFRLQLEFALLALQDQAVSQTLVDDLHADRGEMTMFLEASDAVVPLPEFKPAPDQLATVVIAALQGLQQHRFIDPASVSEELARWTIQALLYAVAHK